MRSLPFVLVAALVLGLAFGASANNDAPVEEVTFTKHVAPIVQAKCQECHRPGSIGPFSLGTYRQVRGWSKMIAEVIEERRMPPWGADPAVGKFSNDRSLTDAEKNTILGWIEAGMPRGDMADMPEPIEWETDWRIGEPDVVIEMPQEVTVDPTGVVPYMYQSTPAMFDEDMWVSEAEIRPGNAQVLHHIILFVSDPKGHNGKASSPFEDSYLLGFAPGAEPLRLPEGQAIKIPAGSNLVWQLHYTPTGKVETDRSQVAFKFAKGPVTQRVTTTGTMNSTFAIPAGDPNHKVVSEMRITRDGYIRELLPHMHLRGKSYDYFAILPDGTETHLLSVPKYDFNWQMTYALEEPFFVPKGTVVKGVAHFDNSEENPYNPDPTKVVREGDQTWEEMMIGFFTITYDDEAEKLSDSHGD